MRGSARIIGRWYGSGRGLEMDGKCHQIFTKSELAGGKSLELGEREVFVVGSSRCDYRCVYGTRMVDREAWQGQRPRQW